MFSNHITLEAFDPDLFKALEGESKRQETHIELIASENYASSRVLSVQGSVLTNKYAEGYPGKRYYGGCEYVDQAENLAIERAKKLFQADYVNVQPHSGSQANMAVYMALMQPGECLLGMRLDHGGHLTHGCGVNFSGKLYQAKTYGVDLKTGLIDFNEVASQALKYRPKIIVAGFSAYARQVQWQAFREIADKIGAYLVVDMAHVSGLVAAGLYPNPIAFADVVTATTHKTLRGPRGGIILAKDNPEITQKLQSLIFPGTQGGPLMHVIAAKAAAFEEALRPEFKIYQQKVLKNADYFAKKLRLLEYEIVSGGTDTHLFLVDLTNKNITGKQAEQKLDRAYITLNKNTIPNDPRSPFVTSGVRIGTPAITTRGFGTPEIDQLVDWINTLLHSKGDSDLLAIREEVVNLCRKFPVYAF